MIISVESLEQFSEYLSRVVKIFKEVSHEEEENGRVSVT